MPKRPAPSKRFRDTPRFSARDHVRAVYAARQVLEAPALELHQEEAPKPVPAPPPAPAKKTRARRP